MVDSSPVMDNWTGRTRRHVTPSALPRLACCALLRHDTRGTQLTARRLKVGTDEPVEQLKLVQVTDQQVVGDGIYLVGVLSSPAVARDDALVGEIECTEVVERTRTPKALRLYGLKDSAYSGEAEMFDLIHQMRTRIMTSPCARICNPMPNCCA